MAKKGLSWRSFFACYGKVGDSPSTGGVTKRVAGHGSLRRRSSFSDVGNCTPPFSPEDLSLSLAGSNIHSFTMAELRAVTQNFSMSQLIGEGGFGPVYKGYVDEKLRPGLRAQTVAVKLLDQEGLQGHKEWLAEVIYLGQLRHPRLVKLIGYCCEDEHRLLVYEFMARGSLENHLFRRYFASLPWKTRIEIAVGAAKGLAFLHEAEKQVIYRDFKASNILLDSDYKAKLSDFGLAKDGPQGEDTHVSTRVMGTQGYAAPEYIMTGHLTAKSDVYSFGVVLLELLAGRRSVDKARPGRKQNLVEWARPWLNDHRKLNRFMDPNLDGQYSTKGAQKAAALAYQCLSHLPKSRPPMKTVVEALEPILLMDDIPTSTLVYSVAAAAAAPEDDVEADDVGKAQGKENGHRGESKEKGLRKMEAKETGSNHHQQQQHHHHHGNRLRIRPPKPVSYTDTALYRNSPRHNRGRGA